MYGVRCLPLLSAGSATRHKTRPHRDLRISEISNLRACEALLKLGELSDKEAEVVEEMYGQIADKFLDG